VLRETRVTWGAKENFYGAALESWHAEDLKLEGFSGESAQPGRIADRIVE
jgi:hypothetical protein